jgi:O-antigen ligase
MLIAIVPLAAGLLLWSILDLERFVLIVVLTSMLFPGDIAKPFGANVAAMDVFTLLALASWLINNAVGNAPDPALRRPVLVAGLIFAGLQWVSLIWSTNPHRTLIFSSQAVELFVAYPLLFGFLPRRVKEIERGLIVLLVGTAALAVALLIGFASDPQAAQSGTYLPGFNKNASGSFESVGIVIAYALLLRGRGSRLWPAAALMLTTAGSVASESRGAMMGAAAGVVVVSLVMRRGRIAAGLVMIMLAATYFAVIAPGEAAKTSHAGAQSSALARVQLWKFAIHQIEKKPILGTGAGAYFQPDGQQQDPNNTFLRTWAETGILGLIALVYLLVSLGRMVPAWRRCRDPGIAALAAACAGMFVSLLVHAQVDVSWTRGTGSLMFAALGLLIALERLVRPAAAPAPVPREVDVPQPQEPRVLTPA